MERNPKNTECITLAKLVDMQTRLTTRLSEVFQLIDRLRLQRVELETLSKQNLAHIDKKLRESLGENEIPIHILVPKIEPVSPIRPRDQYE